MFGKCKIDVINYASVAVEKGCAGVTPYACGLF